MINELIKEIHLHGLVNVKGFKIYGRAYAVFAFMGILAKTREFSLKRNYFICEN